MESMQGTALIAPIVLVQGALLVVAFCISGRRNSEPNHIIGIRTEATMSSQRAWQAAHRAAAPWSIVVLTSSTVALITGAVLYNAESLPANTQTWYTVFTISVFILFMAILSWRANEAAKQVVLEDYLEEQQLSKSDGQ